MIIAFDLDGTLDHPEIASLCMALLANKHEVHIITGTFPEAGAWQDASAKVDKLTDIGIPVVMYNDISEGESVDEGCAILHVLDAVDQKKFDTEYRLRDLGLRKGDLCHRLGVQVFIDDSELYCTTLRSMNRGMAVFQVR